MTKRSRPRNRSSYRDSVLTVPCDKERFQLEEEKIKEAWNNHFKVITNITLKPGEETKVRIDETIHTIVNDTDEVITFTPTWLYNENKAN